jgi:hypothetical protein
MKRLVLAWLLILGALPLRAQTCTWSQPALYPAFTDYATAATVAQGLGLATPADGSVPWGDENFAMVPFTVWITPPSMASDHTITPGTADSRFFVMLRLNSCWSGTTNALSVLAPYLQTPQPGWPVFQ